MTSEVLAPTGRDLEPAAARAGSPGHITVRQRALNTVVRAVSADALGVDPAQVTVTLRDDHGLLGLVVVAPISTPDLDTLGPGYSGSTVLRRISVAQSTIRSTTSRITGNQVGRVDVHVRGAHIIPNARVR